MTDRTSSTKSPRGHQTALGSAFAAASGSQPATTSVTAHTSTHVALKREVKKDAWGRSYATGRRKTSAARVWVKPGKGRITVNGKDHTLYFTRPVLQMIINQPFEVANRTSQFDVVCTVTGGGLSGQAGAVRHGISQALTLFEPELRAPIKKKGFLTRDSREVERKKYGRAKARRSYQFSKR